MSRVLNIIYLAVSIAVSIVVFGIALLDNSSSVFQLVIVMYIAAIIQTTAIYDLFLE
jgi:uncharacterized membrane protein YoaK (UPF0700 family)